MIISWSMIFLLGIIFLCWGSFLNMVGYRIIRSHSFRGRSFCPHCKHLIGWYDLIPLISYIVLKGHCRKCKEAISLLYPFIEFLTALLLLLLILFIDQRYWLGYGIFISASMVTIRTDFEKMLIARAMTWGMIPIAYLLSYFSLLPLTLSESILGSLFGFAILFIIARLFYALRNIHGLGEGDIDLLAMIGAFTGIAGAWCSLMLGSFFGLLASFGQIVISRQMVRQIAFGPWLIAGACFYLFFQQYILLLFA